MAKIRTNDSVHFDLLKAEKIMEIKYENNYSIEKNILITIYQYLTRLQSSSKLIHRYFGVVGNTFFKRLAFLLVSRKKVGLPQFLFVNAQIGQLKFKARSTNSQFHSIYFDQFRKCYEPDVYGAIEKYLPNSGTMLDVGSNWGHHTFDAVYRKDATVFSFEPNADVFNDLSQIISDLNVEHKVTPFNVGLGAATGHLRLEQAGFESGVGTVDRSFLRKRYSDTHWLARMLDLITFSKPIVQSAEIVVLDDFFDPQVHVDLIKIDCEGYELNALRGGGGADKA